MKKILFIFLILVVSFIMACTIYILVTPSVIVEKTKDTRKKNVKVSESIHDEEIEMLFNIYLNETRHRIKWVYRLANLDDKKAINAEIYLDGHQIFKESIANDLKAENFSDLWKDEKMHSLLAREITSFSIIRSDNKDYLVFYLTTINESEKEVYYIMNESGTILNKEEIVKKDITKVVNEYFYEGGNLAKIEDNKIYYLLENAENKAIEEYEITLKDERLEEKLINTYNVGKE